NSHRSSGANRSTSAAAMTPDCRKITPTEMTSKVIGDAARTGLYDLQDLKKVWHCLARFGRPAITC
ncbi:hypothetical protein ACFW9L_21100, partial [Streptomyces sp. NPDC059517]